MRMIAKYFMLLLAFAGLMGCAANASAAAKVASAGANWATATWTPAGVPTASDTCTINSGVNLTVSTAAVCGSLTIGNATNANTTLTLAAGGSLNITTSGGQSGNLVLNPNNINRTFTIAVATRTLTVDGTFTSSATVGTHVISVSTGQVTFTKTTGLTWPARGTLTITGNPSVGASVTFAGLLTQTGGTIQNTGGTASILTFSKGYTTSGGTFTTRAGEIINFGGNLTVSGVARTLNATSTANFTAAASITPTAAITFGNLTINSGVSTVTLAGNVTVSTVLTLSSGTVSTGVNTLITNATCATSVTRTGGWVNGKLQKSIPAGASTCTFQIGDSSNYTPVVAVFVAGTGAGKITASTTGIEHPQIALSGINSTQSVNRYWTLTNAGVTLPAAGYAATFNYINGSPVDLDVSAIPANFIVEQWNGTSWFPTKPSGACTTTQCAITGETVFGDFAIGDPLSGFNATPGAFNTFEATTPVGVLGRIYTKIAGTAISLQVVAVNAGRTGVNNVFNTNPITVTLLDSRDNTGAITAATGCRSTWTTVISTQSLSPVWTSGRSATISITAPVNAWRDVRVRVTQGANTGCSTDRFSIRPTAFTSVTSSATNSGASGIPIFKAGQSFSLSANTGLTGYDNGSGATLANPQIIPVLDPTKVVGSPVAGILGGSFGAASVGAATGAAFTYSEVGTFGINTNAVYDNVFTAVDQPGDCVSTAGLNFSNALNASGQYGCNFGSPTVALASGYGRFVPDHFDTVTSGGMLCPTGLTCPAQFNGFVYSGEPFTTNVYARNAAGATTQNYNGTAGYSKPVTLTAWDALGSITQQNPPAAPPGSAPGNGVIAAASFSQGTTALGTPAVPNYTFGATPTTPTNIYIRATDTDGVTSLRVPANASVEGGMMIVSGRMVISSAYGSEFLNLSVPVAAQFSPDGSSWAVSATDSSTAVPATNMVFSNWQTVSGTWTGATHVVTPPNTISFTNGIASIPLSSPGNGNTGSVDLTCTGTGTSPCTPNYLPSNTARITFGVYKGSSRLIYFREN